MFSYLLLIFLVLSLALSLPLFFSFTHFLCLSVLSFPRLPLFILSVNYVHLFSEIEPAEKVYFPDLEVKVWSEYVLTSQEVVHFEINSFVSIFMTARSLFSKPRQSEFPQCYSLRFPKGRALMINPELANHSGKRNFFRNTPYVLSIVFICYKRLYHGIYVFEWFSVFPFLAKNGKNARRTMEESSFSAFVFHKLYVLFYINLWYGNEKINFV